VQEELTYGMFTREGDDRADGTRQDEQKAEGPQMNKLTDKQDALVAEMVRKQGGYCNKADIRRAAGVKYGDPIAKRLEKAGILLHVDHDHYKLTTTKIEAAMAKHDVTLKRKVRRGRGSY
jgi:hypothetical protein